MGNNNNYFYLSGLISLSLFAFFIALFITMMFTSPKLNSYGLKKDDFISISLVVPKVSTPVSKKSSSSAPTPSEVQTPDENIDVNDLFSDVWTKKIKPKKVKPKKDNSKRLMKIQKQIKQSEKNDIKSLSDSAKDFENIKTNESSDAASTANEVNEYLAKIQALVYKYFVVPQNTEGNSVKTVIELSAYGKVLDFRVLTYSANAALNAEVDKIYSRVKSVIFPVNPQKKSSRTIVILISKE